MRQATATPIDALRGQLAATFRPVPHAQPSIGQAAAAALVPLDGSAQAEAALPYAARHARAGGLALVLAGIVGHGAAPGAMPIGELSAYLGRVAARLADSGLPVRTSVAQGEGPQAIADAARLWGVAVIIMAKHDFGEPASGNDAIADCVSFRASVPVILVPAPAFPATGTDRLLAVRHRGGTSPAPAIERGGMQMTPDAPARPVEILLVEDNAGDARLTREALRDARLWHRLHLVTDGEDALAYLRDAQRRAGSPPPDLLLLDLHLPRKDGWEVIAEIERDEWLRRIPVAILAGLPEEWEREGRNCSAVACTLGKPIDADQLHLLARAVERFGLRLGTIPEGATGAA